MKSVCQEAHKIVNGPRKQNYGHPLDNFERTALIWTAILSKKLKTGIDPEEVGLMMIGLKLSRSVNKLIRDNLVDICGYAATIEAVLVEKKRRGL